MPTYISLLNYTQKGIENMKGSPARLQEARKAAAAGGGEIKQFFLTLGKYDAVVISEAPSDEAYAAHIMAIAAAGAIRSQTLRAFTEEEYRKIVAALP